MCTKNHNHMLYGSWDTEWDRQNLKSTFWKKKKKKMPGDIILLYIYVYYKWRSYDISFLKYKVRQTGIFVTLGHFLPFQPPDNPENQNFKIKRNTGDIIILHIWTINDNHMMYGSWDMEHDRQIFFVILDHFTLYWPRKSKFWKNEKKPWRYCHFTNVYHKWQSYDRQNFLSFWTIFLTFYPPNNPKNQNIEKNVWRYHHFTHVYHIWQSYNVWLLRYGVWRTEFFVILDHFLHFYPPNNLKNQNFEKMKKKLEILPSYTYAP